MIDGFLGGFELVIWSIALAFRDPSGACLDAFPSTTRRRGYRVMELQCTIDASNLYLTAEKADMNFQST